MTRYQKFISTDINNLFEILKTSISGLVENEAQKRLISIGRNAVEYRRPNPLKILIAQTKSFFIYLLLVAFVINLFVADYRNAFIILGFTLVYIFAGFYQEYHAEKSIFKLKEFVTREIRVRRNGEVKKINTEDLVPGDILFLASGNLIPADVRFLKIKNLQIDESAITGESVPVFKMSSVILDAPKDDLGAQNLGFLGSAVVAGEAEAVVLTTGQNTYFANIFEKIASVERPSLFEVNMQKIGKVLTIIFVALIFIAFLTKFFVTKNLDVEFLTFSIALIIAVVPEALPLVITLSMSRGALRLARKKVLLKRLTAIEDMGNINILATDKTGTITKNHMSVESSYGAPMEDLLKVAIFSSYGKEAQGHLFDPFDKAIIEKLKKDDISTKDVIFIDWLPFDPVHKISQILYEKNGKKFIIAMGVPEEIIKRSISIKNGQVGEFKKWTEKEGFGGNRVIAIAKKEADSEKKIHELENGYEFLGALGFADPIKDSSKEAIKLIKESNIDLKIITGDAKEVAGAVGFSLGLINSPTEVMLGTDFEALNDDARKEAVKKYNVFARTSPSQKLYIIETLEKENSVGFLGDGFNDIPALKMSHLSLVVKGAEGMSQSVADIVLLEDDLLVIAEAIREGRKIFANVLKYIRTTLTANIGNFISLLVFSLIFPFLPILPTQILLINLLTDMPMIAVFMDNTDKEEVRKPERYAISSIFFFVFVFGVLNSIFDFIFFKYFFHYGEITIQTGWFVFSIFTELFAYVSLRSLLPIWKASRPAISVLAITIGVSLGSILLVMNDKLGKAFGFGHITFKQIGMMLIILLFFLISNECVKLFFKKKPVLTNTANC